MWNHLAEVVDARLASAASSGQTTACHRRRSGPTLSLLANISNNPVTLSLLLSELNHDANKNSRFVSLI